MEAIERCAGPSYRSSATVAADATKCHWHQPHREMGFLRVCFLTLFRVPAESDPSCRNTHLHWMSLPCGCAPSRGRVFCMASAAGLEVVSDLSGIVGDHGHVFGTSLWGQRSPSGDGDLLLADGPDPALVLGRL